MADSGMVTGLACVTLGRIRPRVATAARYLLPAVRALDPAALAAAAQTVVLMFSRAAGVCLTCA